MTVEAIKVAILTSNVEQLQQYLAMREDIDLNRDFGLESVLCWAVKQKTVNRKIIQILLDLRDQRGQPVININHGKPIYSLFLNYGIDPIERAAILNAILSQRGPQGELIKGFKKESSFDSLLKRVVDRDDAHCLEILLKLRKPNGERVLAVNEISKGTTVLDLAYKNYNSSLIQILEKNGAQRVATLSLTDGSVEDIKAAILLNNVDRLQQCLTMRGNVNLNHDFGLESVLSWAVQQKAINKEIIQILLDLRDERGQRVIDINQGGPIYSLFLNHEIDPKERAAILNAILSQTGPQGKLIKNFSHEYSFDSLLKRVVDRDDAHCLEILLKLHKSNGEKVLSINEISRGTTVLDLAYKNYNPLLIKILEKNGAQRAIALPLAHVSVEDIKAAILVNNINRLQQCLAMRGNIDLNHDFDLDSVLCWAVQQKGISRDSIQILLDLRDQRGQPVIDINQGKPIYSLFLNHKIHPQERAAILDAILSQRGPQGELVKDFREESLFDSLLKRVVSMNDAGCLEILLDVREINGEKALEVNEVTGGTTVLDLAFKNKNTALAEIIQLHGGRIAANITFQEHRDQYQKFLRRQGFRLAFENGRRQVLPTGNNALSDFAGNSQNTHNTEVTVSVNASIKRLQKRYPDVPCDLVTKEIEQFVLSMGYDLQLILEDDFKANQEIPTLSKQKDGSYQLWGCKDNQWQFVSIDNLQVLLAETKVEEKDFQYKNKIHVVRKSPIFQALKEGHTSSANSTYKKKVQKAIAILKSIKQKKIEADINLIEALSLLWVASSDKEGCKTALLPLSDFDIKERKMSLLNNLLASQTEYGPNHPSCFVGMFNKMVEALDQIHPDVTIITTKQAIMPSAIGYSLIQIERRLSLKRLNEQRKILHTWDDEGGESPATLFRKECQDYMQSLLKDEYKTLLSEKERYEITDNFIWLPRPILHKKLHEIIEQINLIPKEKDGKNIKNNYKNQLIEKIQERARNAYIPSNKSFDEEYKELFGLYDNFIHYFQASEKILGELKEKSRNHPSQRLFLLKLQEGLDRFYDKELGELSAGAPFKNFNSEIFNKLIKTASALIIEESGTIERRACVRKILQMVNQAQNKFIQDWNISEAHELFLFDLNGFHKLDTLITHINTLPLTAVDTCRNNFLQKLKEKANSLYNSSKSYEEKYGELNTLYGNFIRYDSLIQNSFSTFNINHRPLRQQIDMLYSCELGNLSVSEETLVNIKHKAVALDAIESARYHLKTHYLFFNRDTKKKQNQFNDISLSIYKAESSSEIRRLLHLAEGVAQKKTRKVHCLWGSNVSIDYHKNDFLIAKETLGTKGW